MTRHHPVGIASIPLGLLLAMTLPIGCVGDGEPLAPGPGGTLGIAGAQMATGVGGLPSGTGGLEPNVAAGNAATPPTVGGSLTTGGATGKGGTTPKGGTTAKGGATAKAGEQGEAGAEEDPCKGVNDTEDSDTNCESFGEGAVCDRSNSEDDPRVCMCTSQSSELVWICVHQDEDPLSCAGVNDTDPDALDCSDYGASTVCDRSDSESDPRVCVCSSSAGKLIWKCVHE